jgi:hypothetical protein
MFIIFRIIACVSVLFCLCAPPPRTSTSVVESYAATILYQHRSFSGGSLSGQTVLVLPVLTKSGLDTTTALSPAQIAKQLLSFYKDAEPVTKEEFETRYSVHHDTSSLAAFYRHLFKSEVVALANSDSVWKNMKTTYCFAARITNALTIHGFNGVVKRRMNLETELWDVDSAEAVLRIRVQASALGDRITDAGFIRAAIGAAFEKMPLSAPSANEQKW